MLLDVAVCSLTAICGVKEKPILSARIMMCTIMLRIMKLYCFLSVNVPVAALGASSSLVCVLVLFNEQFCISNTWF